MSAARFSASIVWVDGTKILRPLPVDWILSAVTWTQ
jgi:hypothetical protein